jgi:hypothetical protein
MRAEGPQISQISQNVFLMSNLRDAKRKIQASRPKAQDPRLKTQDSRLKTQDSRLKTQDSRLPGHVQPHHGPSIRGRTCALVRTVRGWAECKCGGGKGLAGQNSGNENTEKGGTVRTVRGGRARYSGDRQAWGFGGPSVGLSGLWRIAWSRTGASRHPATKSCGPFGPGSGSWLPGFSGTAAGSGERAPAPRLRRVPVECHYGQHA